MAAIYSTRFVIARPSFGEPYVVADGYLAVVRCITAVTDDITGAATLAVNIVEPGGATYLIASFLTEPGSSAVASPWNGRVVVNPGEAITLDAFDDWWVTVSGYLLTLP
jgi:hypothetical protein